MYLYSRNLEIREHSETPNRIDTKELQIDLIKHLLYYFPSVKALLSHQDLLTPNNDAYPFLT